MYVDSHCHIDFAIFDHDRNALLARAYDQGVKQLLIPGVEPEQWQRASQMSAEHGLFYSVGLHPWWIANNPEFLHDSLRVMRTHLLQPRCVAVGECGLDAFIDIPLALQIEYLNVQLALASELKLPVVIHCRKAHNELILQLKKHHLVGGVIHGFSGSYQLAQTYWALGFYLGVGGAITYARANKTREAIRQMPIESLVLETDAPDMPLSGRQGQRNSPEYIPEIANILAEIRNESLGFVAAQTTANAQKLFKLDV